MTAAISIVRATAKRLQGERRLPFFMIGLPILIMLLVGTIFGTGGQRLVVGIVAPERDLVATDIVDAIGRSDVLKPRHFGSARSARQHVRRGRISAAVILRPGTESAVAAGHNLPVEVIVQPGRTESFEARLAVGAVLARLNVDVAAARALAAETDVPFATALQRASATNAGVGDFLRSDDDDDESPFAYTAPSNLVLFAFITALVTSAAIVEARRTGVTRRILASPTRPGAVVAGELVAAFLTALLQATVMFVIGSVFFGVGFGSPAALVPLLLAIALVSAAAGSLLATFVRTPDQSVSFGPPIGIAMGMLGGCMWPLEGVGPVLRAVGHVTPQAWAMDSFVQLIFVEAGIGAIAFNLVVLVAMAGGLLVLAATRLRRTITLS